MGQGRTKDNFQGRTAESGEELPSISQENVNIRDLMNMRDIPRYMTVKNLNFGMITARMGRTERRV
jgi:hypothetical protein